MKQEEIDKLIQSLKTAKVEKDRKWVYTLIAWALKNQETKSYTNFQTRIQSSIHYAKGKYQEYWNNPKNKAQHDKSQAKCIENNKEQYREISRVNLREKRILHKLFKEGKLSKKSTALIESKIVEV